ncbi:hypothetical protein RMCBS344292_00749 [Rhizopus microsporus]|nr:hypothetical protein RMCBS344292_00749 [Rhizopus microsporus]
MPTMNNIQNIDRYVDYDTFLADNFDATRHVEEIMKQSEIEDESDVTAAFSRLTFGIDILNKQIQEQVK